MMKKILIYSPAFNDKIGGIVVLHKLCHILNELNRECFLYPMYSDEGFYKKNWFDAFLMQLKMLKYRNIDNFNTNSFFKTPVLKQSLKKFNWDNWIVIYPEIVLGNPLGAKNVVRWLLHQPGFHTGKIQYGPSELYIKYNTAIRDFNYLDSIMADTHLKIIHYPREYYNLENISDERTGTAYCLRKGSHKKIQHNLENSILIDDLPHNEIAAIFKKVKRFISYDTYTAYSVFAVLCGCESVVVPDDNVSEEEWYPNPTDRFGIAYGMDKVAEANLTKNKVIQHVIDEENKNVDRVRAVLKEVDIFFS